MRCDASYCCRRACDCLNLGNFPALVLRFSRKGQDYVYKVDISCWRHFMDLDSRVELNNESVCDCGQSSGPSTSRLMQWLVRPLLKV